MCGGADRGATYQRKWVRYEIKRAWNTGKGLFGIYIHNLDPVNKAIARYGKQGENPFSCFDVREVRITPFVYDSPSINLSNIVPVYNPNKSDAYNEIKSNVSSWVEKAISARQQNRASECSMNDKARMALSTWGGSLRR